MKYLSIVILILLPFSGWAQDDMNSSDNTNPFVNELGFHAGLTTAIGLSYRHWVDRFGFQFTGLPIKSDDYIYLCGGFTGMYSLKNSRKVRIFTYWGNSVYHERYRSQYSPKYGSNEVDTYTQYNTGVGFGFSLGQVVAFNAQVGYGAFNVFGGYDNITLSLTGELGLYYRF